MSDRPCLQALAERVGILPHYHDINGDIRHTSDHSRESLLSAMGFNATSEESARLEIQRMDQTAAEQILPPVRVVRRSAPDAAVVRFTVPPDWNHPRARWRLELREEAGSACPNPSSLASTSPEPRHSCRADSPQTLALPGGTAPLNPALPGAAVQVCEGHFDLSAEEAAVLSLPLLPDLGYHDLTLMLEFDGTRHIARQRLIVVPDRCFTVEDLLGDRKVFGICANLYTLRSDPRAADARGGNWGVGDLTDLAELCEWAGRNGAAFVGLSPLHALRNLDHDISPYSPISRVFRNTIFLDVTCVPEFADCQEAQLLVASSRFQESLEAVRSASLIAYEEIARLKREVMRLLFSEFRRRHAASPGSKESDSPRERAFADYCQKHGDELTRFATFCALDAPPDQNLARSEPRASARAETPPDPNRARKEAEQCSDIPTDQQTCAGSPSADEIEFHKFLQFELDRQLAFAAKVARAGGMSIGLYQDLAIGTSRSSADVLSHPELFVDGATLGAPPDDYSATGQDWSIPPIHPLRLAEDGYRYWSNLLRANMAHTGALRIDHVMGLLRQFWIPTGPSTKTAQSPGIDAGRIGQSCRGESPSNPASPGGTAPLSPASPGGAAPMDPASPGNIVAMYPPPGAYVRYPVEDLFGILALESVRHRAIVIGEDLGTVPTGFSHLLERWGVLSCQVMYFQRGPHGEFLHESEYSSRALVTTTTHDHVSLHGFLGGDDLRLRRQIGDIECDEALHQALVRRGADIQALLDRVGLYDGQCSGTARPTLTTPAEYARICAAVYAFLSRTPAPLLGLMLDDLTGESEPVNLPGIGPDRHSNWSRRMSTPINALDECAATHAAFQAAHRRK